MGDEQGFSAWEEELLGIPVIDRQHANLIRITNNLHLVHRKGAGNSSRRFISAAHEAVDYVKFHFSTEEKLMKLMEYPDYSGHKKEHEEFTKEILSRCERFQSEEHHLSREFAGFMNVWVKNHISVFDRNFTEYFLTMPHHNKLKILASA